MISKEHWILKGLIIWNIWEVKLGDRNLNLIKLYA